MNKKNFMIIGIILLLSLACTWPGSEDVQSKNAEETAQAMVSPPAATIVSQTTEPSIMEPSIISTQINSTPTLLSGDLNTNGPWVVLSNSEGLYLINFNGTGLTKISSEKVFLPDDLSIGAAPSGGRFAFVSSSDPNFYKEMKLHVLNLPSGNEEARISLTTSETEPQDADFQVSGDISPWRASGELAWSPNGEYLAFTGLIEGETSDVYSYSTHTHQARSLTDGPTHAYNLLWSPDNKFVLHYAVNTFGTGAGYSMGGSWAARADESAMIILYPPTSGDEIVYGWISNVEFLVGSWSAACGYNNLRVYHIENNSSRSIFDSCYSSAVLDDQVKNVFVSVDQYAAQSCSCGEDSNKGLYHIPSSNWETRWLNSADVNRVSWLEDANLFKVELSGGETRLFNTGSGTEYTDTPAQADNLVPYPSPNGEYKVWLGQNQSGGHELWLEEVDVSIDEIIQRQVAFLGWDANSSTFAFLSNNEFCSVLVDDLSLHCVETIEVDKAAIVNP